MRNMLESFHRNKKGILLMACSSICACLGQLFWKLSADHGFAAMLAGFCLYGIGAIIMIIAYRYGKLSVLQPMLSMNYILSIFLAAIVLHESITIAKGFGVILISVGVVCIAGGDEE